MNTKNSKKTTFQKIPWWLYLLLAIASYCTLTYFLPSLKTAESTIDKLLDIAPKAAPIISIAFLLLAANALYRDDPPGETSNEEDTPDKGGPPSP